MTVYIQDGFWRDRLEVNARRAIFHQWEQLETSGCIENFRIAAGGIDGFRYGYALRRASLRVRGHRGKVALTHSPIVYCLESVDNPDVDIFTVRLGSKRWEMFDQFFPPLGEHVHAIYAQTPEGKQLTFIPYFLWGNRGLSQMNVWINQ